MSGGSHVAGKVEFRPVPPWIPERTSFFGYVGNTEVVHPSPGIGEDSVLDQDRQDGGGNLGGIPDIRPFACDFPLAEVDPSGPRGKGRDRQKDEDQDSFHVFFLHARAPAPMTPAALPRLERATRTWVPPRSIPSTYAFRLFMDGHSMAVTLFPWWKPPGTIPLRSARAQTSRCIGMTAGMTLSGSGRVGR